MDSKNIVGISTKCLMEAECRMKEVGSANDIGGIMRMYQDRLLFAGNRTIQILYDDIKETSKWLTLGIELNKCVIVLSVKSSNIKYGFIFRKLTDKERAERIILGKEQ